VISIAIIERVLFLKNEVKKNIVYDNLEFVKPINKSKLMEDLENKTGLKINRVSVGKIDYKSSVAMVTVFYYNGS
jgi:hypothetical protein